VSSSSGLKHEIRACVLTVGTEITEGKISDGHGRYLSAAFRLLSIRVRQIASIPDDSDLFVETVARMLQDCDILLITGGLGPTSDDLTREVVSQVAGRDLEYRSEAWSAIESRLGANASETNRKQAFIPGGFELLPNENGTAPGFFGYVGEGLVIALPGPPRELRPMFESRILPLLKSRYELAAFNELAGTAFLTPESRLEQMLQEHARPGVTWGTRFDDLGIAFFLRGASAADRRAVMAELQADAGEFYIREGEIDPAQILFSALDDTRTTLCTAESCTGGLIAKLITDIAGSSVVFWGGWVVYSNEGKQEQLGVSASTLSANGAVSRETVREMAQGARRISGAGISISVSGIAGPAGGTDEKPVGTVWIGISVESEEPHEQLFHFRGDRNRIRRLAAVAAMLLAADALRRRR